MRVVRERYLRQLSSKRHNGLVKVITGLRRCGKSIFSGHCSVSACWQMVLTRRKQVLMFHEIDFVVNRAPGKLYIQSAWKLPTDEKRDQELLPLRRSGDFFAKIIITEGLQPPMKDNEDIVHVGVIPFLLDESILDTALETANPITPQLLNPQLSTPNA